MPVGRLVELSSKAIRKSCNCGCDVSFYHLSQKNRMYVQMQKEKYGDDIENIMFRDKKPYGYVSVQKRIW